jgi:putative FmdB family regulatory protein
MPLYEYKCKKCGHRFEKIVKFSDPPHKKCPKCKKIALEQLVSSPAIQFKGTGWYVTDYAGKSAPPEESSKAEESSKEESSKKGEETKSSEQKADEKSDQKSKDKKKDAAPKEAPAKPAKESKATEKATADKRR